MYVAAVCSMEDVVFAAGGRQFQSRLVLGMKLLAWGFWGLREQRWVRGWLWTTECNGHCFAILGETASQGAGWGDWLSHGLLLGLSGCLGCWSWIFLRGAVTLPASGHLCSDMDEWRMRTPARATQWWGKPPLCAFLKTRCLLQRSMHLRSMH